MFRKKGHALETMQDRLFIFILSLLQNIDMQDYLLKEPQLLNKTAKSITAFSSIFSEDLDSIQSNDMKITSTELGASFKQYDIKNIAEPITKNPCNFSLARGWMSNGVWNISCMEHFKSNTFYIYID